MNSDIILRLGFTELMQHCRILFRFPLFPGVVNFGTLGAVIRTKSAIPSKKVMFDIGVAGPIAGFIATLLILSYGFLALPGKEFILSIHPQYFSQTQPAGGVDLTFGNPLLYQFLSFIFTNPTNQFVPPMTEMYHYPFLCAGWFGLFVTSMNLLPVGQLDGGHLAYTMFGPRPQNYRPLSVCYHYRYWPAWTAPSIKYIFFFRMDGLAVLGSHSFFCRQA